MLVFQLNFNVNTTIVSKRLMVQELCMKRLSTDFLTRRLDTSGYSHGYAYGIDVNIGYLCVCLTIILLDFNVVLTVNFTGLGFT